MDLMWMVLLVDLVYSQTQNVRNVSGELGQDVTLTCSVNQSDFFWFMEIHNNIKAGIGRIFSLRSPIYCSPDLKTKYLIAENRLVIKKVSVDDGRRYFCRRTEEETTGDAFLLLVDTGSDPTDSPAVTQTTSTPSSVPELLKDAAVATLFCINVALLVVVLCVILAYIRRKGCRRCCRPKRSIEISRDNQDMQNPQYEEIQLPPSAVTAECIYYKAQHPQLTHLDRWSDPREASPAPPVNGRSRNQRRQQNVLVLTD